MLISKQRPDEALEALRRGYALWRPKDDDVEDENEHAPMDLDEDVAKELPSFQSRLSAAKMFVELADPETALDVLSDLLLEQEDEVFPSFPSFFL